MGMRGPAGNFEYQSDYLPLTTKFIARNLLAFGGVKYGQFCPVAKASEVLGERWTLLVVRELIAGATTYTELQRGLGRISPSVLSSRLKALIEHGIVEKLQYDAAPGTGYRLTAAGAELAPIIQHIGGWGQRWVRSRMTRDELDVELLMLHIRRNLDASAFPLLHGVVGFVFSDLHGALRRWWLLIDDGRVELCTDAPGRVEDVVVTCQLKTLVEFFNGDILLANALRDELLVLRGSAKVVRSLQRWLRASSLAAPALP
jgi:DNA-binding HxlR family transcriptional regulator